MQYYAVIVASGSGKRMEIEIPKQFILLNGKPMLQYSLEAFHNSRFKPEIILVLNEEHLELWQMQIESHQITVPHRVVVGGAERFHSVKNGISGLDKEGFVAIHDGARPLIKPDTIDRLYTSALLNGSAIPVVDAFESVRYKEKAIDRHETKMVQTPQTFSVSTLQKAYQMEFDITLTDDASVVEKAGFNVHLEMGQQGNFKITYPEDGQIADFLIQKNRPAF